MTLATERDYEDAALQHLADLGYARHYELPGAAVDLRFEPVLEADARKVIERLNPELNSDAVDRALKRVTVLDGRELLEDNRAFHRMLTEGVELEVLRDGAVRGVRARLVDFNDPDKNDWLVARQVRVPTRSGFVVLDLVVYLNGFAIAAFELKSPSRESATTRDAYVQLENYQREVPAFFLCNELLVIADGANALLGVLGAPESRFLPWRVVSDEGVEPTESDPLQVLIQGVFDRRRLLEILQGFVTFESASKGWVKKVAGYHQFHAVRRAVKSAVAATRPEGDRKIGVVWHTQGSGKSLTMVFFAARLAVEQALENPTLVVITDRNDLDNQLFDTFSKNQTLLRQPPVQAESRAELRTMLETRASGGVIFTTLQKFAPIEGEKNPALSLRSNIIVVADEAHRSQYGFASKLDAVTGKRTYGLAHQLRLALPHASFVGFTGTPIERDDRSTEEVFGPLVSRYDIERAVRDGATVPIYYENRAAKVYLDASRAPVLDDEFEEVTEGVEVEARESLKTEWSALEAIVGAPDRLRRVAQDIVAHLERRQETLRGKSMIVCMSRMIAARLYEELRALRPAWHDDDPAHGAMKVIVTGSASDEAPLRQHVTSKGQREELARRFKDPSDPLQLVLVRDMWLTGFDAPCMHTLYVDKPMQGHNLMQAIARVNRVFADKPGGLVVDYIGIAPLLRKAMGTYSNAGGRGDLTRDQSKAVELLHESVEICEAALEGCDYRGVFSADPRERLAVLARCKEFLLSKRLDELASSAGGLRSTKRAKGPYERFMEAASVATKAFAMAIPDAACDELRDTVAFFQALRVSLVKLNATAPGALTRRDIDAALRAIVANSLVSDEVVDVFDAAGMARPDISVLSTEFLADINTLPEKNIAIALLQRLLEEQVRTRSKHNVVQGKRFSELLQQAIQRYQNRALDTAQVIQELIALATAMRDADARGEAIGLTREESAFYDALAENESALRDMGEKKLVSIARELTEVIRRNATIDWTRSEAVQARLRVEIKKRLKKWGYPPDAQLEAVQLVLAQARALGIEVSEGGAGDVPPPPAPPAAAGGDDGERRVTDPGGTAEAVVDSLALPRRELPYPLAVLEAIIASQVAGYLRVKTRLDSIERALVSIVAVCLGLLRDRSGAVRADAAGVVGKYAGRPLSFGAWLSLLCELAALLSSESADPLVKMARAFVDERGKMSSLAIELQSEVIPLRNRFSHGVVVSDDVSLPVEGPLRERWNTLRAILAPLRRATLFTRAEIKDVRPDGTGARCSIRVLHGSSAFFACEEKTLPHAASEEWCWLLTESGEILRMEPLLLLAATGGAPPSEVFVARSLSLEPGAKIDMMASSSGTEKKQRRPV
ncbi:MAG: type I restriction endonuclease subunit R [Deltaproteobacteria bacterium]|nr:type I restriction endonuclease subunit R [Deltaproteobacteria bacterium]